jgi:hypothetical protein
VSSATSVWRFEHIVLGGRLALEKATNRANEPAFPFFRCMIRMIDVMVMS